MNSINPFRFENYPVRVQVDDAGLPLFNVNDVCEVLGFGNSRQALETHVDPDDVQKMDIIDSLGRVQHANYVNESGLYALILGSTKESAKRFKRWVTNEVLPSIRRTGFYSGGNTHGFASMSELEQQLLVRTFELQQQLLVSKDEQIAAKDEQIRLLHLMKLPRKDRSRAVPNPEVATTSDKEAVARFITCWQQTFGLNRWLTASDLLDLKAVLPMSVCYGPLRGRAQRLARWIRERVPSSVSVEGQRIEIQRSVGRIRADRDSNPTLCYQLRSYVAH